MTPGGELGSRIRDHQVAAVRWGKAAKAARLRERRSASAPGRLHACSCLVVSAAPGRRALLEVVSLGEDDAEEDPIQLPVTGPIQPVASTRTENAIYAVRRLATRARVAFEHAEELAKRIRALAKAGFAPLAEVVGVVALVLLQQPEAATLAAAFAISSRGCPPGQSRQSRQIARTM